MQIMVSNDFPMHYWNLPLNKVARVEPSLENLQLFTRIPALQYFQAFEVKKP